MPYPKPIPDDPGPLPGKNRGTPGSTGSSGAPSGSDPTNNSAFTSTGQAEVVTVARGRVKLPATLIEKLPNQVLQPASWLTATQYRFGEIVSSAGNAYRCILSGVSTAPPNGGGSSLNSPYTSGQTVIRGDIRASAGNAYIALVGGTCGSLGPPTGTAADIPDSGGVVHWAYLGAAPFPGVFVNFSSLIPVFVIANVWQYLQALPYNLIYQRPVFLLCEGQVSKVVTVWLDKLQIAVDDPSGLSLPVGLGLLPGPDAGGQVLPGGPFDSTGYQHSAVLVAGSVFGTPTGTQAETQDVAAEIDAVVFDSLAVDMNAADHVTDQLQHTRRGFSWPSSRLHSSIGSADPASLRSWSDAKGVRFSHVNDSATAGVDLMSDYANACNTIFFMSQGKLKAVPLDDTPTTSPVYGSVNYVPNNVARYNLTPNDVKGGQPLSFTSTLDPDRKNNIPVQFNDRSGGYVQNIAASPVLSDIQRRGIITGPTITLPFVFPDGTWPSQLSRIAANASLYNDHLFTVTVMPRFIALEQGDIITVPVGESITNWQPVSVRITQIDKGSDFWLALTCVDYPAGIAAPAAFTPQRGDGLRQNGLNTIGSIPAAYQQAQQTNQRADLLFPNGSSENPPPSAILVLNDGSSAEWDYRFAPGVSSFTGSIASNILTVTAVASGTIGLDQLVTGTGVALGTRITTNGTGGIGTYSLNISQTVSSTAMASTGAYAGTFIRRLVPTPGSSLTLAATVQCMPGESFVLSVKARASPPPFGTAFVTIRFVDANGNTVGSAATVSTGSDTWIGGGVGPVVAPEGTTSVRFELMGTASLGFTGTFIDFDSVVAKRS